MSEVERLRDRIGQLEAVLGVNEDAVGQIRRAFPKMYPDVARILAMLMKREFVTRDGLYTVMYGHKAECDMPDEGTIDVQICRLRAHLEPLCIAFQTASGEGWFMSKADKAKVRFALDQAPLLDLEAAALANDQRNKRQAFLFGQGA